MSATSQPAASSEACPVYNLTRSIEMLEASFSWKTEFATPHQPWCSGVGMRTSFLEDLEQPFAPLDEYRADASYTDLVRLDDGLYLRVIEDTRKKTCTIMAPGENWLKFSFVTNGSVNQDFGQHREMQCHSGHAEVYLHAPGTTKREMVEDSCWGHSVTLYYSPAQFAALVESYIALLPASLRDWIDDRGPELILETIPMTNSIVRAVVDIINAPYYGSLRHTYVKAKAAELMCEVVHLLTQSAKVEVDAIKLSARDKRQLEMARQIILDDYVDAPTIAELARHVGLNQRKLKMGFKQMFGTTIFDFAQTLRLDRAWELLSSGDYAIGQVADMVGYNYAKNFTTAFKKHFGVSPKVARNCARLRQPRAA